MGAEEEEADSTDGEGPVRPVTVAPFAIAAHPVTNAEFAAFVDATGYGTTAEREGWSFVFAGLLPDSFPPTRGVADAPWWRQVHGARWDRPEGRGSTAENRWDHPVVHVSWIDALAYCRWSEVRLLGEAEWEFAARGGLEQKRFPWGDELAPDGRRLMNAFEGPFPHRAGGTDGWTGTSPVGAYPPNGFGLLDMTGNVWEWTADRFGPTRPGERALRGGSYLCHASYCERYRCAARMASTPDSTAGNVGFRVAGR
ncbi:formylglycine-generating enzyme family protein [Actinomycetes bacterium KLBMP 9759]